MTVLLTNNARSTLLSGINALQTEIRLRAGGGNTFPTITAPGQWFPITIEDSVGAIEIMRVIARSGDVFTVKRAQEGTTAKSFSANDVVELRLTVGVMQELVNDTHTNFGRIYMTPADGVDSKIGVPAGYYFNVRSPSDDSYVDEYQNVNGVAVATGKSYPSGALTQAMSELTQSMSEQIDRIGSLDYLSEQLDQIAVDKGWDAAFVVDASGLTQQGVNDGLESVADLMSISNPSDKLRLFVKGYHAGEQAGSGYFYYDSAIDKSKHDGGFYIDPTRAYPSDWTNKAQKQAWYETGVGTGKGCFVRDYGSVYKLEYFGAKRNTEASIEINAFFTAITARMHDGVNRVEALGSYKTDSTIWCRIQHVPDVSFSLKIQAIAPMGKIVRLSCANSVCSGTLYVRGTGSYLGTDRTCDVGISLEACILSTVPTLDAEFCREWGVLIDSTAPTGFFNNSTALIPMIRVAQCGYVASGSSLGTGKTGVKSNYTNITRVASNAKGDQESVLNVTTLPPTTILNDDKFINYAIVNNHIRAISSIDRVAGTVGLFPLLPKNTPLSGNIEYIFGGGVLVRGSDSNAINIGNLATTATPVGLRDMSFYGVIVSDIVTHVSTICYAGGWTPQAVSSMSSKIDNFYTEGRVADVVFQGQGSLSVLGTNGQFWKNINSCFSLRPQGGSNDDIPTGGFSNVYIGQAGSRVGRDYMGAARNYRANNQIVMDVTLIQTSTVKLNYAEVFFTNVQDAANRLYGLHACHFVIIGTGSNGAMTGNITLKTYNLPSGWTLQGGSVDVVITPPTNGVCYLTAFWDWTTKNIQVYIK